MDATAHHHGHHDMPASGGALTVVALLTFLGFRRAHGGTLPKESEITRGETP